MVAGAVGGLAIGAAVHPGSLFVVSKIPSFGMKCSSTSASLMAIILFVYVMASPLIAWRLSRFTVSLVISCVQRSGGG